MNEKHYYVYIITNKRNTVLYVGVTSKLPERIQEHFEKQSRKSFSVRYNINKIVYYEEYLDIDTAIAREKQIKAGSRKKKIELIENVNPNWNEIIF